MGHTVTPEPTTGSSLIIKREHQHIKHIELYASGSQHQLHRPSFYRSASFTRRGMLGPIDLKFQWFPNTVRGKQRWMGALGSKITVVVRY